MKFLSTVRWMVRTVFLLVVALLLVRALVEYIPALQAAPLFRALVRSWDPVLSDLVESVGLTWSREVRALLLPGVAIGLILLRLLVEDLIERAFAPPKRVPTGLTGAHSVTSTVIKGTGPLPATGTAFRPGGTVAGSAEPGAMMTRISRYEILHELGHGAMGVVYKAQDPKIGRIVAIKTLSAAGQGTELEQYRARFLVEAKSAGRLNHPNIVAVHDVTDDEAGRPCLVLEFVEGTTLDRLMIDEHVPLGRLLELVGQVAHALAYAHAHGIVHRDVKPANIMVTKAGQAKLSDFGIAKLEGTSMTIAGQVMGTPAFMSPEQCTGSGVDARSDIFSLGSVLYTLSAGEKPFAGDTFTAVAYKVVHAQHPPVRDLNPELPIQLDVILARCLAKDPKQRYQSAEELAVDLEALRASLPAAPNAAAAEAAPTA
ncbi:MAG: serine/threonine-protein kinase [Gammaproteobacteria bacterium]